MYEEFYGLRERPFDLTPNPKFMYLSARHYEALSVVQYGIVSRKGLTLLVGEAGTGKTTVVRAALEAIADPNGRCVYLSNPTLNRAEFYEFLAISYGLTTQASASKARFLVEFEELLAQRTQSGALTALVIDEAQSLSTELMEEIRLLANLETSTERLLPVVMAGQPELSARLDRPELRHLKQRVALRADLAPFALLQTAAYIAGRIRKAGGEPLNLFTKEAVTMIHEQSGGIPRTISVICDNAMLAGLAAAQRPIGPDIIEEVASAFRLHPAGAAAGNGNGNGRYPRSADDQDGGPWHLGPARAEAQPDPKTRPGGHKESIR